MRVTFVGLSLLAYICSACEVGITFHGQGRDDRLAPRDAKTNDEVCAYGHNIWGEQIKNCNWNKSETWWKVSPYALDISRPVFIQIAGSDALWASQFWLMGDLHGTYTTRTYGEYNWYGWCMSTDTNDLTGGSGPGDRDWTRYVPAGQCFWSLRFDPDGSVWGFESHPFSFRRLVPDHEWSVEVLEGLPATEWKLIGETFEESKAVGHGQTAAPEDVNSAVESAVVEDGETEAPEDENSAEESAVVEDGQTAALEDENSAGESAVVEDGETAAPDENSAGETAVVEDSEA